MFLPFVFYSLITSKNVDLSFDPKYMLFTGAGYILAFAVLVFFIRKRNLVGVRLVAVAIFLISLPTKAFIGIGVAIISLLLTLNKKVQAYFT